MATASYQPTIGLEIHVELTTRSKMFCGCKNDPHDSTPNAHLCPVCLAHPGTLPVPNEEAIALVVRFGQAIGATIATYSEFDRKHYFYPDIPKAYQISQYAYPFLVGGSLQGVTLTRVHLEEDTARSQHEQGEHSLVDFNRAGVPLMELVTEPVIHTAEAAAAFARELQLTLRMLNISTAHMERGEMRVEANVSVSSDKTLGTKVEVKNLNSFRSVEQAIRFEIERQTTLLVAGAAVEQETRGWDEQKQKTFTQRKKETAKDYRYFPDPDLPKMLLQEPEAVSGLDEITLETPQKVRDKYKDLGVTSSLVETIISDSVLRNYFAQLVVIAKDQEQLPMLSAAGNFLTTDVGGALLRGRSLRLSPKHFWEVVDLFSSGKITSRVAKNLLAETLENDMSPSELAMKNGLLMADSAADLLPHVEAVIADFPLVVAEYRAGKEASIQYLVGQIMKRTQGAANPVVVMKFLRERID
jgi:aspartyl-tRNA(Asn)/glutamyl-tRNA(Gln) amidotransferase subunit B